VWRLRCAISMELLKLVCVCNILTSTADLVLPRCFLMANRTRLWIDVAEEDKHLWLLWWFDIVFGTFFISFTVTFTLHFGRTKCSVKHSQFLWYNLCSTEDYLCVSQRLTWATTSTLCCYTSFNTSCLVLVPYDHSHKCTQIHHTLVATGSLLGRYHVLLTEIVGGLIQKSTLRTIWERKLGKTYFVALYSTEWPYTVYCYCDFHNTSIHYTLESICSPFLPRANNWLIWNLIYRKSSLYYCCCIIHSLLWCIFSCIQL